MFQKFIHFPSNLTDKKKYIEFISATLSVPVLITVILINLSNLNKKDQTSVPTEDKGQSITVVPVEIVREVPAGSPTQEASPSASPTILPTTAMCKRDIGPISITSPDEDDTVTDNPVSIVINYEAGDYCAVVWSYRINDGPWSPYDDKSIALYNLPNGGQKFELKIKSITGGNEKTLIRNFTYEGAASTPAPSASPSGTLQ